MTIERFQPLSEAEAHLVAAAANGGRISFGEGARPEEAAPEVTLRADLVRHVLLARDVALHDQGLRLRGAWICGKLDLQGCTCEADITLTDCVLDEEVSLLNAQLRGLHLSGLMCRGMMADNARFSGSVYLRGGSVVAGEISLAGARIGGDLQVCGAEITSPGQDAVFAPSLHVAGSIFPGNYPYSEGVTDLRAQGTLFLASARVGHDVFVTNTAVGLNPDIVSGMFDATEEHGRDMALSLGRAQIGGILYFKDNQIGQGIVNLAGARVRRLRDEPAGPGANYPIRLDGFHYDDFSRHADTGIDARLDWLARRPEGTPFVAQPYEQLARVLTALGHRGDARTVLMRKERELRRWDRQALRARGGQGLFWAATGLWDVFLRFSVGYGYRPGRSVLIAAALIGALGLFFQRAWDVGDMTPNAAPILVSADWIAATEMHPDGPAAVWASPGQAGQDWETFNAYAYAADIVIPLVSLGQEEAWAPSTSRSDWGRTGWWIRWFAKGIGWVIAALAAAAITGVIRKE